MSVRFTLALLALTLLSSGGFAGGCSRCGSDGRPAVLVLSSSHAPSDSAARGRLEAALTEGAGFPVEVRVASSPVAGIEAFGANAADVGLLPVTQYLFARQEYGVEARLQVRRAAGAGFVGEIVVRADSPYRALADLAGKRIAYAGEFSTSGFLLPAARLADEGVEVEAEFAGGHDEAVARLEAGTVDAAATYRGVTERRAGLRAVATTEPIPNEPVFVRAGIDVERARRLLEALVAWSKTPEGAGVLDGMADVTGFEPVTDAVYDALRDRVRSAGRTTADLVPGGRALIWANNQPILAP